MCSTSTSDGWDSWRTTRFLEVGESDSVRIVRPCAGATSVASVVADGLRAGASEAFVLCLMLRGTVADARVGGVGEVRRVWTIELSRLRTPCGASGGADGGLGCKPSGGGAVRDRL